MTRPTKKTPDRVKLILDMISAGNTQACAAEYAEIDKDTIRIWAQNDPVFSGQLRKARALAEARFLGMVTKAATKSWQAAAWWLERRRPDDYRQQSVQQISGNLQVGLGELMREARKTKQAARDVEPSEPEV